MGKSYLGNTLSSINTNDSMDKNATTVTERDHLPPIEVSTYYNDYDITSESFIDVNDDNNFDYNYIEFLQFIEDPVGLLAIAQDRIKKMLVSAAHISPERGEEISQLLYDKIHSYSKGDSSVDLDDAQVTSIINSIVLEDSDRSRFVVGVVKGLLENMDQSFREYTLSDSQKKTHKVLDYYDELTKREKEAIDIMREETIDVNAVIGLINKMETDARYQRMDEEKFINLIREKTLSLTDEDKLFEKMQKASPNLTRERAVALIDRYAPHYIDYNTNVEQAEFGASKNETALGGSAILSKVQNSIIGEAAYKYIPKARVLDEIFAERTIDGQSLNSFMQAGFRVKDEDDNSEVIKLNAYDVYSIDMLKQEVLSGHKEEIRKSFGNFAKFKNALIGLDRFSRKVGDFNESIEHVLNVIPKDYRRDRLSDYLTQDDKAEFDFENQKGLLRNEASRALNSIEKLDIVDQRKSMKASEVKQEVRRNIETYKADTLGQVYSSMVYDKIAFIKKSTLENFSTEGKRGIDNALFELRSCLASSLVEKNNVATVQSMANDCVKKYIDAQKKESSELMRSMSGSSAIILGGSGIAALILIYAIYKDNKADEAEKKMAHIEAETYKHIKMLEDVTSEPEAIGQKIYSSFKTSREGYIQEKFKDTKEKEVKSAIFASFAKDISSFYTLGGNSSAFFKTEQAQEYKEKINDEIFKEVFNLQSMDYVNIDASLLSNKEGMTAKLKNLQEEIKKLRINFAKEKNRFEEKAKNNTVVASDSEKLKTLIVEARRMQAEEIKLTKAIREIDLQIQAQKYAHKVDPEVLSIQDKKEQLDVIYSSLKEEIDNDPLLGNENKKTFVERVLQSASNPEQTMGQRLQNTERPRVKGKTNERFLDVYYQGIKDAKGIGIINTLENLSKAANGDVDTQLEIIRRQEVVLRGKILEEYKVQHSQNPDEKNADMKNFDQSKIDLLVKLYQENIGMGKALLKELNALYDKANNKDEQHKYTNMDVYSIFSEIKEDVIQEILEMSKRDMDKKYPSFDKLEGGKISFDQRDDNIYISFLSDKQAREIAEIDELLKAQKIQEQTEVSQSTGRKIG